MTDYRHRDPVLRHYEWDLTLWSTSQTRAALDATGRGIYRELIDLCYAQGGFSVKPLEPLCHTLACTQEQFKAIWGMVRGHFRRSGKGFHYSLPRALKTRDDYKTFCERQRSRRNASTFPKSMTALGQLTNGQTGNENGPTGGQPAVGPNNDTTRHDTTRHDNDTTSPVVGVVELMQESLTDFMAGKWGKPDRDIAEQALAACNGAPWPDISTELLRLHRSGARPEKSWGWFVTMLSRRFA